MVNSSKNLPGVEASPLEFHRSLFIFAGLFFAIACMGAYGVDSLSAYWDGYYGGWRDAYLQERVQQTPFLCAVLAGLFTMAGLFSWWSARKRRIHSSVSMKALILLLIATLATGLLASYGEWMHWGGPCWDSYCSRAILWAKFIVNPSMDLFRHFSVQQHAGTSLFPPILIGSVVYLGASVQVAYMGVNLLSWLGVAALAAIIANRFLAYDRRNILVMLILLFGHLSVMRSLLFLQTDAIAMFLIMLALYLNLSFNQNPSLVTGGFLIASCVIGFFTKLSFLPIFSMPVILWFLDRGNRDKWTRGLAVRALLVVLFSVFISGGLLWVLGLNETLLRELNFITDHTTLRGDFYKDFNPLRFFLMMLLTFQFSPFFLKKKQWMQYPESRLLYVLLFLFPGALIFLKAAFWLRYVMPVIPFMILLSTPNFVKRLGNGPEILIGLSLYAAGNAAFIFCRVYY